MRVAGIIRNSVVNGNGIRDVLFLQGCCHYCKGCHNPETWNQDGGDTYFTMDLVEEFKGCNQMTISGGEPLLQFDNLCLFMNMMNVQYGTRFWLYTGFIYEEIGEDTLQELVKYVDVLVDGKFVEELKDLTLRFRGSSNQRLIDLPKSVKEGTIILWEDDRT